KDINTYRNTYILSVSFLASQDYIKGLLHYLLISNLNINISYSLQEFYVVIIISKYRLIVKQSISNVSVFKIVFLIDYILYFYFLSFFLFFIVHLLYFYL